MNLGGVTEALGDWYGASVQPLAGGYSGETFVAGTGDERVVVRIYARSPERAAVDASLLRLVRGLVPVPEVLELRQPTATSPAVLVTSYVAGTRLDLALHDESLNLDALARSTAKILDTLAGIPFLRPGVFADSTLALDSAALPRDLREWADRRRPVGRLATWSDADWATLTELLDAAEDLLERDSGEGPSRAVLVHSDFNPKNILVDPATAHVLAVLDWEFAHAGSVYTDLGNFCRFERDPRLVEPLLDGLAATATSTGGPANVLRLARAADLWALVELAGRASPGPVPDLATELLLAQARSGDLEAWPWRVHRVEPGRVGERG